MDSSDDSCIEDVDFEKFRKIYESDEHWKLRKVRMNCFVYSFSTPDSN